MEFIEKKHENVKLPQFPKVKKKRNIREEQRDQRETKKYHWKIQLERMKRNESELLLTFFLFFVLNRKNCLALLILKQSKTEKYN